MTAQEFNNRIDELEKNMQGMCRDWKLISDKGKLLIEDINRIKADILKYMEKPNDH